MKKIGILVVALLLCILFGCKAEPQWETVDDDMTVAVSAADIPFVITFGIPSDAVEQAFLDDADRSLYVQETGDYEIISDVITAVSLDDAMRAVSGFDQGEVSVLETSRFGLPEYQFAWYSTSEEGSYVSRASLVRDGGYYYALVFSIKEGLGTAYNDCADAVFASFGLHGDEQF